MTTLEESTSRVIYVLHGPANRDAEKEAPQVLTAIQQQINFCLGMMGRSPKATNPEGFVKSIDEAIAKDPNGLQRVQNEAQFYKVTIEPLYDVIDEYHKLK